MIGKPTAALADLESSAAIKADPQTSQRLSTF